MSGGLKRKQHHMSTEGVVTAKSQVEESFSQYAQYLDFINEKRERLVKASRDITMNSKKVIFSVHRATSMEGLEKAAQDLDSVKYNHITRVARELQGEDYFHFSRAFSPGVQEYVEAASFLHFCKQGGLLTLSDLNQSFHAVLDIEGRPFHVSEQDYVLGLGDLTGEVMRLAVSGSLPLPHTSPDACRLFVQQLYAAYSALPHSSDLGRDFGKKSEVMLASLRKIENVAYALHVRGSEYPEAAKEMLLKSLDAPDPGQVED